MAATGDVSAPTGTGALLDVPTGFFEVGQSQEPNDVLESIAFISGTTYTIAGRNTRIDGDQDVVNQSRSFYIKTLLVIPAAEATPVPSPIATPIPFAVHGLIYKRIKDGTGEIIGLAGSSLFQR